MDYSYYTISAMKSKLVGSQEMGCHYSHAVVRLINIIVHDMIVY